ncbi:MAG: hypothetical protein KDA60_13650 [Planctomycetales bacterium]|nr:hypothetical protein [Planctomycetales bacterium]
MSAVLEAPRVSASTQAQSRSTSSPSVATGTFLCLVVSANPQRREQFVGAAQQAGWDTAVCRDGLAGATAARRTRFQLALVDLEGLSGERQAEMRDLSGQLAGSSGLLLTVCGNEGDGLEEIWARQLGAWMYLPGVTADCDLTMVCQEALPVAARLNQREVPARRSAIA